MQALPRLLVAVAIATAAGAAHADRVAVPDRGYRFASPAGLTYNESLSMQVSTDLAGARHYDGLATEVGADAYVSDDGFAFYVQWIHATEPARDPALAMRRTFDRLRQAPVDKTSMVSSAELVSWAEHVDDNLAVGDLEWRHISNETVTRVRDWMYVTPTGLLRQLRGDCVMQAGGADRLRARCDAAFAALRITDTDRGELGALPSAGSLRLSDADDAEPMLLVVDGGPDAGPSNSPSLRPPTEGAVLYEQPARRAPANKDNTFLYLGGAILLIIGVYVLMRRPRDQDTKSE